MILFAGDEGIVEHGSIGSKADVYWFISCYPPFFDVHELSAI